MKDIVWIGTSLDDLRAFPDAARARAGHSLDLVQRGLEPPDWKPMHTVGAGAREIRIHAEGEYRVFFVAKLEACIYVLHAFHKKSQKTAEADIEIGRRRYQEVLRSRERER